MSLFSVYLFSRQALEGPLQFPLWEPLFYMISQASYLLWHFIGFQVNFRVSLAMCILQNSKNVVLKYVNKLPYDFSSTLESCMHMHEGYADWELYHTVSFENNVCATSRYDHSEVWKSLCRARVGNVSLRGKIQPISRESLASTMILKSAISLSNIPGDISKYS